MQERIDGNAIAGAVIDELKDSVAALDGPRPCVVFIRVGEDPASVSYVNKKQQTAAHIGIESRLKVLPETITQVELLAEIDRHNKDDSVDGILVQAPLPKGIDATVVFNHVAPDKDVDGFGRMNLGRLCQEDPDGFVPCTPAGIIEIIKREAIATQGQHAVIVGRSLIVGKPMGLLLLQKSLTGNATVTVCHSHTPDMAELTRQADLLIVAIGRPHTITESMVKPGAVVIDVGINRIADASRKSGYRLVGDVDFDTVASKASKITPVPGGVGPMTVAMLMQNTYKACLAHRSRTAGMETC